MGVDRGVPFAFEYFVFNQAVFRQRQPGRFLKADPTSEKQYGRDGSEPCKNAEKCDTFSGTPPRSDRDQGKRATAAAERDRTGQKPAVGVDENFGSEGQKLAAPPTPGSGCAPQHQGAVGAAESKIVFHRHLDFEIARDVGAIIKIALGILIEDVDRWGDDLMVQR